MTTAKLFSRRRFLGQTAAIGAAALAGSCPPGAPSRAMAGNPTIGNPWQIGCYTRPWAKYDYRTAMDAIAEAGFKHVGLMTANTKSHLVMSVGDTLEEAVRVGGEAKKCGLEIPSIYGGQINVQRYDSAVVDLRHLIDLCAAAGAKNLLIAGVGELAQYGVYYGAIADCCDYAADKKLGLTIKPHGPLNATGPQLRSVIEKVNHKNFTAWYDAGNVLYYSDGKLNPVDDAAALNGLVTGWCIKDYQRPKQVDVTPGTGQVDFRAIFARLKRGGFTGGPLIVETLSSGDLPHLLVEARKARQFLEALISQWSVEPWSRIGG
jgi:sugar phosphate isomerase/epimerase